jgi:hypothetical protein
MEIADDKPMIQMIGDSQTGKTFVLDKIGRAIVGTDFKVQPLPRSAEAFENVMINNDLAFFDNVNAVDPAIASLICMAVTGCKIVRRELFTTRKQLEVPSKVTLGISALTSVLPTTEQANRSLTINLLRRPRKSNVSKKILLAEFDVEREALVSEMIVRAQMVLKALKTQEGYRPAFDTRLADVATLILKVARHEGWEDAALNLLKTWDDEQQDEALKEDDLSSCLAEFLYKPGWVSRVYHAGELNAAMKPLNANPNDVSWKWSPVSLSSKLRKSAESYGRRFGLKIGEDEHTKTATFTFDPPDRIETTEAKGENTVNIDSKEPIAPEWDNDPSSRPIEWERGKPIFVKPGDSPHGEGYLRPSDIACIPAELPAEVKEGIIFWSRTLVHGGWEGVFDYTPTEAVMMFCTHYGDEKPDLEGWRAAFTRIKGINDGGAGKAIEEAALPTSLETNQEAVKTEKGQESIRYWGGACGVKAQITDFVIKIPL